MNHSVHSFINGCLTLKLSGSWNTVTCSSPDLGAAWAPSSEVVPGSLFSLSGETGMVSRGTGEEGLRFVGAGSSVAITA